MENNTIHIACALDDNFLMPISVMLVSLFATNKTNKFQIHLFSANLKKENVELLQNTIKKNDAGFQFYPIDKSQFKNLKTNYRVSFATYYRILVPQIIDRNIKKILYLDGDIIINGNIKALWETELDGYIIGAVNDVVAIDIKEYIRLNVPKEFHYFNAGVLLIDTEKWNLSDTSAALTEYLNENIENCKFFDQDGFNAILFNKCKKLSPFWNQQVGVYFCDSNLIKSVYPNEDIKLIKKNPAIVHFNGMEKPWHYVSLHPFKKKFRDYLKLSGVDNFKNNITFKKLVKKEIYRFLGWERWNRHIYIKYKRLLFNKSF